MEQIEFSLAGEYIELIQLLKATTVAQTGGHAKMLVEDELVLRNGEVETRKRAKIRKGDCIVVDEAVEIVIK